MNLWVSLSDLELFFVYLSCCGQLVIFNNLPQPNLKNGLSARVNKCTNSRLSHSYMGIGLSAQGVNMNRLPGKFTFSVWWGFLYSICIHLFILPILFCLLKYHHHKKRKLQLDKTAGIWLQLYVFCWWGPNIVIKKKKSENAAENKCNMNMLFSWVVIPLQNWAYTKNTQQQQTANKTVLGIIFFF